MRTGLDHRPSIDPYRANDAIYQLSTILEGIRREGKSPEGWYDFYRTCIEPINHHHGRNADQPPEWDFHSPHPPLGEYVEVMAEGGHVGFYTRPLYPMDVINGAITYRTCLDQWEIIRDRILGDAVTHPRILAMRKHFRVELEDLEYFRSTHGYGFGKEV